MSNVVLAYTRSSLDLDHARGQYESLNDFLFLDHGSKLSSTSADLPEGAKGSIEQRVQSTRVKIAARLLPRINPIEACKRPAGGIRRIMTVH